MLSPIRIEHFNPSMLQVRAYRMFSVPRGRALIVNIMNYDGDPDLTREGSELDVERLTRLFKQLKFEVECLQDCTKNVSVVDC